MSQLKVLFYSMLFIYSEFNHKVLETLQTALSVYFFLLKFTQKFNFSHYFLMFVESKAKVLQSTKQVYRSRRLTRKSSPLIKGPSYIFANSIWALRASIVLDFIQAELCCNEMSCGLSISLRTKCPLLGELFL